MRMMRPLSRVNATMTAYMRRFLAGRSASLGVQTAGAFIGAASGLLAAAEHHTNAGARLEDFVRRRNTGDRRSHSFA